MTYMNKMGSEVIEATNYLEGFSYTDKSRKMWKIIRGVPNGDVYTGIQGTSALGVNNHQENWVMINRFLDKEEEYDKDFSLAVLVASASNPKGSKQVRNHYDANKKGLESKRKRLAIMGRRDHKEWTPQGWSVPVDTTEDLLEELDRQMDGKKDKHDVFMEQYYQELRDRSAKRAQEAEERIKSYREARGDDDLLITGTQRALTPEEARDLMARRSETFTNVPSETSASPEDKDRFIKKVGSRVLTGR